MSRKRLIARLDVKNSELIKTVQLEGLRVVGDPQERMKSYYDNQIDELLYMDIVASLYGRNSLYDLIEVTAENCFVPLTVGGGIRSIADARLCQQAGADKFAVNSAAIERPEVLRELSEMFGSQAVVLSVEAKLMSPNEWHALFFNGRETNDKNVLHWIEEGCSLGIGEVLVTSVDREGTRKGFDLELARAVAEISTVPVIISGGFSDVENAADILSIDGIDGIAVADALHFDRFTIHEIKTGLTDLGISLRIEVED